MTITKTLKTKLVLGILAAAVSLSLAIGGTLMLFTAQSGPATNVVTLGNADIALQEAQVDTSEEGAVITDANYATVGENEFSGIVFEKNFVPGDTVYKQPRVKNTGNVPVYVYVEGTLSVKDAENQGFSFADFNYDPDSDDFDATSAAGQLALILSSVVGHDADGWLATGMSTDSANNLTGTWYYATETNNVIALTSLASEEATGNIFEKITIPFDTVGNALAGYVISLELKAYAVQSENNTSKTIADLQKQFTIDGLTTPAEEE
jgi:predicted ribosomally synthesized peptide with SipW-like signal peptide